MLEGTVLIQIMLIPFVHCPVYLQIFLKREKWKLGSNKSHKVQLSRKMLELTWLE
jgi:hypothetical protein